MNRDAEAQGHFLRAVELAPSEAAAHYFYARWLHQRGRYCKAAEHLLSAIAANPDQMEARHLLLDSEAQLGRWIGVEKQAKSTIQRFPADSLAYRFLSRAVKAKSAAEPKQP